MNDVLLLAYLHVAGIPARALDRVARGPRDRGDVPGWVMITVMTAALVIAILGVFRSKITQVVSDSLDNVTGAAGS